MASIIWTRWKRLAHRAAEFQANALFFVLYFIAILPMRLLRLGADEGGAANQRGHPRWIRREPASSDLESVRRQF
jgi:hypothetical protein